MGVTPAASHPASPAPNWLHRSLPACERAWIDSRALPRPERLNFLADVGERRVHFPTHAVIQRQVRSYLPAVLRKEIGGLTSHQFMLRRALNVAVRQPKEIIGIDAVGTNVISSWPGSRGIEGHPAVDVEVQELVEFLVAHIAAKLEIMISDDFAEVIAELERIADLRQLAPSVVSDGESAVQLNEGHAFYLGP